MVDFNKKIINSNTKKAFDLGYRVTPDGKVYKQGNPVQIRYQTKSKKDRRLLYFFVNELKTNIYVSKLQAYQKYGDIALTENCFYLDGNPQNCSYENISLKSILKKGLLEKRQIYCTKCNKILDENQFYSYDKKEAINRIATCKNCLKQKRKNIYDFIQSHKVEGCICCGEKDVACLDFHHIKDKYEQLSHMLSHSKDTISNEIDKCVVLCANCHRKLHFYNISIEQLKEKENG